VRSRSSVGSLLRLRSQHVVEPVEEHPRELALVPEGEQGQHRARREGDQGVERDELAEGEVSVDDLDRADEEEQAERGEGHQLQ